MATSVSFKQNVLSTIKSNLGLDLQVGAPNPGQVGETPMQAYNRLAAVPPKTYGGGSSGGGYA